MSDGSAAFSWPILRDLSNGPDDRLNKYTLAALERHKREGLELAVRARWVTVAIIAVFLVFLNPRLEVVYYHFILALLAGNGWLMLRAGRVGRSGAELFLIFLDLFIMTYGMVVPNPLRAEAIPLAMQYSYDNFVYFYFILAAGTLAYSWRTVISMGTWTAAIWTGGWLLASYVATPLPDLSEAAAKAFGTYPRVLEFFDPNNFVPTLRIQEAVVFVIVAGILALSVRRFNQLLLSNAGLERERANLSRYFSPNVVDELSRNDDPLKQVRSARIGVLFIDIVGFTRLSEGRDPHEVIELLRGFHGRMEAEVFRHGGTLDKYLGDGLMATFGTPVAGDRDASNALACGRAMLDVLDRWNRDRRRAGEPEIEVGIGIHFGAAVMGDIGANRLEFAVIGTTVNVAARLEAKTRELRVRLVISDALHRQVTAEAPGGSHLLDGLERHESQQIRGLSESVTLWALG